MSVNESFCQAYAWMKSLIDSILLKPNSNWYEFIYKLSYFIVREEKLSLKYASHLIDMTALPKIT